MFDPQAREFFKPDAVAANEQLSRGLECIREGRAPTSCRARASLKRGVQHLKLEA